MLIFYVSSYWNIIKGHYAIFEYLFIILYFKIFKSPKLNFKEQKEFSPMKLALYALTYSKNIVCFSLWFLLEATWLRSFIPHECHIRSVFTYPLKDILKLQSINMILVPEFFSQSCLFLTISTIFLISWGRSRLQKYSSLQVASTSNVFMYKVNSLVLCQYWTGVIIILRKFIFKNVLYGRSYERSTKELKGTKSKALQ